MAEIQEKLILVDMFSGNLNRFTSGMDAAARMARTSFGGIQNSAANMSGGVSGAVSETANRMSHYQSMVRQVEGQMLRLNVVFEGQSRHMDGIIQAGGQGTEAFRRLDQAMESTGEKIRNLGIQHDTLTQRMADLVAEQQREAASMASLRAATAEVSLGNVQAQAAAALQRTTSAMGSASESAQRYAAQIVSIDSKLINLNMELTLEGQRLTEVVNKHGAASDAAMQQMQTVSHLSGQVEGLIERQTRLKAVLEQVSGGSEQANAALRNYSNGATQASSVTDILLGKIKSLAAGFFGLQSAKALIGMSDTLTMTTARLDLMNDGLQSTQKLQDMIYQSAVRSRGAFSDSADMVAKLGVLAGEAFNNNTEVIAFAEQLNKHFTISGTNTVGRQAAMLQLTQAMSMGVLRGQELRSVMQQVPTVVQTIADQLGVTTGQLREMAAQGQITSEVVKNALLAAADETNARFASMPMTWAQVWTQFKNAAVMALQPVLAGINFLANHMNVIAPLLAGVTAGVLAYAGALGIVAAAQWIATGAAKAFFTTLLTNPFMWIALLVGVLVAALFHLIQSVGGVKVAWAIMVNWVLTTWDWLKIEFQVGVYWVANLLDEMKLKFKTTGINIVDFMGDMKVGVLNIIQGLANGTVDIVNFMIVQLNRIPGIAINTLDYFQFAANAALEHEAAKQGRAADLAAEQQAVANRAAGREQSLAQMRADAWQSERSRLMGIDAMRKENASMDNSLIVPADYNLSGIADDIGSIAGNTADIAREVDKSDEDLKLLEDVAIRRYETKINTTQLTPNITVQIENRGENLDGKDIADRIKAMLLEQVASHTVISYAEV